MSEQVIICPECGCEIPLTEAISARMRSELEKELRAVMAKREKEMQRRQDEMEKRERELEERLRSFDEELGRRLEQARAELEKEAAAEARKAQQQELEDLQRQLEERDRNLAELRKHELELRRRERELERARQEQQLEMERRLDEERKKLTEELHAALAQQFELKEKEYQGKLEALTKQLDEARRRAEGGSGRDHGEALEEVLEDVLRRLCPEDDFEAVKIGQRGADLLQKVNDEIGRPCGTIIWEAKNTRNWSDGWIDKLKTDQREAGADIAVIVSRALPRGLSGMGNIQGIWVCDRSSLEGLAFALRMQLREVSRARAAAEGREQKMEMLYDYLSGPSFRQKVAAIVEAFQAMQADLDKERQAMQRLWKKREKQIERVIASTSGMYGELQGIIGASLPEIKSLDLKAIAAGDDGELEAEEEGEVLEW